MSGSFFGGLALTTDGSTLTGALGAADPRVPYLPATLATGLRRYVFPDTPSSTTTLALVAGTIYARGVEQDIKNDYDQISLEVTTLSTGSILVALYENNNGAVGSVIGYGTVSATSTGEKTLSFASFTQSIASYFVSNKLRLTRGQRIWVAVQAEATPTLRAASFPPGWRGDNLNYHGYSVTGSYTGTPPSTPAVAVMATGSPPIVTFRSA